MEALGNCPVCPPLSLRTVYPMHSSAMQSSTKFSQPCNIHICITSSQFSLLADSLLTFGHTCWSINIIFSKNNRSFLPVCFPSSLEPTPGFPPSTTHKSLQFCLTKFFEWQILPTVAYFFLLQDWLHGFPETLDTDTSEHIGFYFLFFLFSTFVVVSVLPPFCKQNLFLFIQRRWQRRRTCFFNHYNVLF